MPGTKAKPVPVAVGDSLYVQHPERGPVAMRVLAHGADGVIGQCDAGKRYTVPWPHVLGHRARMLHRYSVVEQGADGALLEDDKGQRRYIAGELPPPDAEERPAPKAAPRDKDPLTGGMDKLTKAEAMDEPRILFLKAGPIANRPGLALQARTDKRGRQAKHWVRTMKDMPKERPEAQADAAAPEHGAPMEHGDVVAFRHGDVGSSGKIVGSGADGVTVTDRAGQTHQVRHEHLVPPEGEGGDAQTVPPDQFTAADFAKQRIDDTVTPADVLKGFPPDTAAKIDGTNQKLARVTQTIDRFKKDGQYVPERAAVHNKVFREFLSPERIKAATPKDGKPTFTILGGRGGSGKSWFKGKVYDPATAIVLDADEIKQMLPEYQGWNAAEVHEESGDLFDAITAQAQKMGLNIVHDATMKTASKAVALAKGFKDGGYRIEAHYMFLPPAKAAKRAVARFLGPTKRFVPPGIVLGNKTNEDSFDQVKAIADAWSFRDNDVAKGQEPKLISESAHEADAGQSGRDGLPPAQSGQRRDGPGVAGGDAAGGSQGALRKALAAARRIVLHTAGR